MRTKYDDETGTVQVLRTEYDPIRDVLLAKCIVTRGGKAEEEKWYLAGFLVPETHEDLLALRYQNASPIEAEGGLHD